MIDEAAKGENLDAYGDLYGIERKRFIIFFWETDKRYRKRIICELERMRKELPNHERNHIVYVVEKVIICGIFQKVGWGLECDIKKLLI